MKITKLQLKHIIKEELNDALNEAQFKVPGEEWEPYSEYQDSIGVDWADHPKPSAALEEAFLSYLRAYREEALKAIELTNQASVATGAEGETAIVGASTSELFNQVTRHLKRISQFENKFATENPEWGQSPSPGTNLYRSAPRGWWELNRELNEMARPRLKMSVRAFRIYNAWADLRRDLFKKFSKDDYPNLEELMDKAVLATYLAAEELEKEEL